MSATATPLEPLNAEEFRQRLAGLIDPDAAPSDLPAQDEYRAASVRLCVVLAGLFGDSLDRVTLWDRTGSALATACAKVADGDLDRFVSLCLEHVKADAGRAAADDRLNALVADLSDRPAAWSQGFVRYVAQHAFAVLVHGRRAWQAEKESR